MSPEAQERIAPHGRPQEAEKDDRPKVSEALSYVLDPRRPCGRSLKNPSRRTRRCKPSSDRAREGQRVPSADRAMEEAAITLFGGFPWPPGQGAQPTATRRS